MEIARFYDETLTECESALTVRLIAIPSESLAAHARSRLFEWPALLGVTEVARLTTGEDRLAGLASLIRPGNGLAREIADVVLAGRLPFLAGGKPVTLATLGAGPAEAGGLALVQLAGLLFLLGTSDDGVVLCGPARALSEALQSGLAEALREAMGLVGTQFGATGPTVLGGAA